MPVHKADRGAAQRRHRRAAQQALAAREDMDGAPREDLAAAKALRHELHRVPARFFERVRRLQARIDVPVHGPLRDEVRNHRSPADACLVLRHKMVVRDDIGDKMRRVTQREGAVLIAA
jgi:hypothetical protein